MRFKDSQEQQQYMKHASSRGNVELVYAGLDVLGSMSWQINRNVFHVMLEVWNSGDRLGKLPPAVYDEPEPEKIPEMEFNQEARSVYIQRHRQWLVSKANSHSDRCSVNYKIEIARAVSMQIHFSLHCLPTDVLSKFLGDTFYFPHNVDFRGRAYPLPAHLNHLGDDLSRSLLLFGEAKPIGERGLRWLKIHLANMYGYDKATFDERVEFVHERLDDVFDSAENPLHVSLVPLHLGTKSKVPSFRARDVNGGKWPMTRGSVWPPASSSRLPLNCLTHTRTSVRCPYTKTEHVTGCNTMLRLVAMCLGHSKSILTPLSGRQTYIRTLPAWSRIAYERT
jgi:hypothetical protein